MQHMPLLRRPSIFRVVSASPRMVIVPLLAMALTIACKRLPQDQPADAGHTVVAIPKERIDAVNNAKKQALYQGPTGTIEGTVSMTGDAAPDLLPFIDKIPADCAIAANTYGKLFREGAGRAVADVLVAATGYTGYVKPKVDHVDLRAQDCAWIQKTVALTFGQRIDVKSVDSRPYIPQLLGAPTGALLVAVPMGDAVPIFPPEPGHYVLIDSMRLYSKADVFVVRYPTWDVTNLNGRYRIEGIPVGLTTLSALLPSTSSNASRQVTITPNATVHLDLTLSFDRSTFRPQVTQSSKPNSSTQDAKSEPPVTSSPAGKRQ